MFKPIEERAHSKFSASGSERWLNCAYSVDAEESSPPSKDSVWSIEGTVAHEVYEAMLNGSSLPDHKLVTAAMIARVSLAVQKVKALHRLYGGALIVEKRVYASFIHEEMFGTTDTIIAPDRPLDGVRTLHILDYKDGAGHIVDADENTQLIQYALSVAEKYGFGLSFDEAKLWILQPRSGKHWHKSWTVSMEDLEHYWLPLWQKGVARVERGNNKPCPGAWCHWCRAKFKCPAKVQKRTDKFSDLLLNNPLINGDTIYGFEEKGAVTGVCSKEKQESKKGKIKNNQQARQESAR